MLYESLQDLLEKLVLLLFVLTHESLLLGNALLYLGLQLRNVLAHLEYVCYAFFHDYGTHVPLVSHARCIIQLLDMNDIEYGLYQSECLRGLDLNRLVLTKFQILALGCIRPRYPYHIRVPIEVIWLQSIWNSKMSTSTFRTHKNFFLMFETKPVLVSFWIFLKQHMIIMFSLPVSCAFDEISYVQQVIQVPSIVSVWFQCHSDLIHTINMLKWLQWSSWIWCLCVYL